MAGDPQLELRLTRLENDTSSIYELLSDISSTLQEHSQRFDGIDRRFESMEHRFDGIDQRFESMEHRLDGIDQRFESMGHRFDGVEATLAEIVRRLPEPF